ncbi:MAG: hypothetical protein KDD50_16250 [Bdellovibrionales bacterium]|nr:hypothetical protein [Bdellovibrionales bacterium]
MNKILLLLAISFLTINAQAKDELNPYGRLLMGGGIEAEVAFFKSPNKEGLHDALIKFYGLEAFDMGIDKKVLKYRAIKSGRGIAYVHGEVTRLFLTDAATSDNWYEAYLGKKIKLGVNYESSKSVQPQHLLTEFQKTKK